MMKVMNNWEQIINTFMAEQGFKPKSRDGYKLHFCGTVKFMVSG